MSRRHSSSIHVTESPLVDDLTLIQGIGPINQGRLLDAGFSTFEKLAASNAEEIADFIPNLSAQQILKQGWIRQARKLMASRLRSSRQNKKSNPQTSRQHYQNFTLEFLLDQKGEICRLRVVHIQSGDINTWPDWNAEQLFGFFAQHTMARPLLEKGSLSLAQPEPRERFEKTHAESISPTMETLEDNTVEENTAPFPIIPETKSQTRPDVSLPEKEPNYNQSTFLPVKTSPSEKIRLLEWEILQSHSDNLTEDIIIHDQRFTVRLTLDLNNASLPEASEFKFKITLLANKILGKDSQIIGETDTTMPIASIVNLFVRHASLPAGFYCLEAFINLKLIGIHVKDQSTFTASFVSAPLLVH
jgi:hypothetical protein